LLSTKLCKCNLHHCNHATKTPPPNLLHQNPQPNQNHHSQSLHENELMNANAESPLSTANNGRSEKAMLFSYFHYRDRVHVTMGCRKFECFFLHLQVVLGAPPKFAKRTKIFLILYCVDHFTPAP